MKPLDRVEWTVELDRYVRAAYPDERHEILDMWLPRGIEIATDQRDYDDPSMIAIRGVGQWLGFRVLVPRELVTVIKEAGE